MAEARSGRRLHLPDCLIFSGDRVKCDCNKPRHPLRANEVLVRRYSKVRKSPKLQVIPRSRMRDGERDLAESQLHTAEDLTPTDLRPKKQKQRGSTVWS